MGSHRARLKTARAVLVALSLLGALAPMGAAGQTPQTPPASPSDPPFWARPRQAAPAPNCDCAQTATIAEPGSDTASKAAIAIGGILLSLFLVWRRLRPKPEEDTVLRPALPMPPPRPAAPLPDGVDPRAARQHRSTELPRVGVEDMGLVDPRAVEIELAQDEPGAESAGAQAFYAEIAASLIAALHKEPERQDLRRKLLEIYFAARQTNEFVNLAHEYRDRNGGVSDKFWPDIGAMGARLAPDHELFQDFSEARRARVAVVRRAGLQRRFYEKQVDQGRLYAAQQALTADYEALRTDEAFGKAFRQLLADSAKRPAPLAASPELTYVADGAQIYVKHEDRRRFHDEDLINATGQILVAQRLGRTRVVTATRNAIHGHAVASAASRLGMQCTIYITERDLNRHYARVLTMRRLGASIRPIPLGGDEPADPRRNALEAWLDDPAATHYVSGLTGGPSPYPEMVREFLSVIGRETLDQMQQLAGGPPSAVIAGVADGYLGLGLLTGLLDQRAIELHCIEEKPGAVESEPGSLDGGMRGSPTRREHRWLRETQRVNYATGDDQETLQVIEQYHATGTTLYTQSARTLAYARALARRRDRKDTIVVLLTGQDGADFRSLGSDW